MKHAEYLKKLAEGQEIILPSGLEVRIKPVDSAVLLNGSFPAEITALVKQYMTFRTDENAAERTPDEQIESFHSNRAFGELIAKNVVVYPKLVDKVGKGDDEFPVAAVETGDLVFLQGLINLPLAKLAIFCRKQNALMERVFSGEDVEAHPVEALRDEAAGAESDARDPSPALFVDGSADHD